MALFKVNTLKKVNSTKEKFNKKKAELLEKRTKLLEERDVLRSALEDDFQLEVMEGKAPDKKLQTDFDKVNAELECLNLQLGSFDGILSKELEKHKADIKKESDKVISTYQEQEAKLEEDLKKIKLQYLEKLIEYHNAYVEADREYQKFWGVMDILEISKRPVNKNVALNMVQDLNNRYQGMFSTRELKEAYHGKLAYSARTYKEGK